ncbi:MAG TPA: SufD family Fe-S cluster assembly protein, partial [Bacilli bacterium]|nr:SufD family Fe-S cluster assembly protein [Bacilli bacterium]
MKKYNIDEDQDLSITYDKKDIEINIKDNVSLNLFELVNIDNNNKTIINLGKDSRLILNRFCNKNIINSKIEVNLNGERSHAEVVISTISNENQIIKININHNNKHTYSNVINSGITIKNGKLEFDIETKIEKGNINSNANQDSKIITMDNVSSGIINPKLIIN